MTTAILLLDPEGVALVPATLCAEAPEEARELDLPLLDQVLSQLSAGKELRPNGDSLYELFQDGQCVAMLEILEAPCLGVP
jgi:hypothetical protein